MEKSDLDPEYRALIGSGQNKIILAVFGGKYLVNFDVAVEEENNSLNTTF